MTTSRFVFYSSRFVFPFIAQRFLSVTSSNVFLSPLTMATDFFNCTSIDGRVLFDNWSIPIKIDTRTNNQCFEKILICFHLRKVSIKFEKYFLARFAIFTVLSLKKGCAQSRTEFCIDWSHSQRGSSDKKIFDPSEGVGVYLRFVRMGERKLLYDDSLWFWDQSMQNAVLDWGQPFLGTAQWR